MRVVLAGMEAPPNFGAGYTREFRAGVSRSGQDLRRDVLIPFFLDGVAGVPALNQADGIHPTAEGQRLVAADHLARRWRRWSARARRPNPNDRTSRRLAHRPERRRAADHPASAGPVRAGRAVAGDHRARPAAASRRCSASIAGLDAPTSGAILIDGVDITRLGEDALARLRGDKIGFVFQFFHLIPSLTARENVLVPMELAGRRDAAARGPTRCSTKSACAIAAHHYPSQLSGGEQQRVAIARALANDPPILLADEPTGNLDSANGRHIMDLLVDVNRARKTTLVLVTHDPALAAEAGAQLALRDGRPDLDRSRLVQLAPPA